MEGVERENEKDTECNKPYSDLYLILHTLFRITTTHYAVQSGLDYASNWTVHCRTNMLHSGNLL